MTTGGGTLKTLSLTAIKGEFRWVETVIDMDKILHVVEYPYDEYPGTCLLSYSESMALHVDVPIDAMRKIMDGHKQKPMKNFDTHPEVDRRSDNQ